jgi:hypothetical protein
MRKGKGTDHKDDLAAQRERDGEYGRGELQKGRTNPPEPDVPIEQPTLEEKQREVVPGMPSTIKAP